MNRHRSPQQSWNVLKAYIAGALKAGAKGFLLKDAGPTFSSTIRAAAEGDALIAPRITTRLFASSAETANSSSPPQPFAPLTGREEEVLVTVAQGRTNAEIADELHISLSAVKFHLASLMNKIGAPQPCRNCHLGLRDQASAAMTCPSMAPSHHADRA